MPLKGKKIFITGGTGGMGKPLIRLLQEAGAIVECYDRSRSGDLVENLDHVCERLAQDTPDIVINMAGYNLFSHCEDQNAEQLLRLNLLAPIRLTQAVLPAMKARNTGHIINIGSMSALIPLPHMTSYVASKAGLKGFSDALRRELSGTGITVTLVTPRAVNTPANKGLKLILNKRAGIRHDEPDIIATRIFTAIYRREKDVRIGWPERFFAFLNAVFPAIIDHGLKKNRALGEEILLQHKNQEEKTYEQDTANFHCAAPEYIIDIRTKR